MRNIVFFKPVFFFALFLLIGCGTYLNQPMKTIPARIGEETPSTQLLRDLPAPKEKIITAVYKFRDQTGQYKPTENGTGWSTAVTQGATSILIRALEESQWFLPIERENVSNLLNERKIIRSSRAQFQENPNEQLLPPLLFAGIILEGGIISYDANILTGGVGLRYFGTGGSGQYRQDRVTIYLRAISTSSGQILKTVYTSKTILSQAIDVNVFRFVKFERLLEFETGITYNEPSEMAVTGAIEKAVQMLVMEGIMENLWGIRGTPEDSIKATQSYLQEKEAMLHTNLINRSFVPRRKRIFFGSQLSMMYYQGDLPGPEVKGGWNGSFGFNVNPRGSMSIEFGQNALGTEQYFDSQISHAALTGQYLLLPYDRISPFVYGGIGGITRNIKSRFDFENPGYFKVHYGGGIEYLASDFLGIHFSVDHNSLLSDKIDETTMGKYNDFYWQARLGVKVYFGKDFDEPVDFFY